MRRLTGEDEGFLLLETPTAPMNSMAIGVLVPAVDPSGIPQPITMTDVRAHFARRLGELPSLRWRLQRVPFQIHHHMVIEDPDFDLGYHLRHATVPAPGGPLELDRLVASLGEQHMDRRHPLWQFTLVDGLADGKQAGIYRVHHALQDGVAAYTSFSRIFSGAEHEPVAEAEPWEPDQVPRQRRLVAQALRDLGRDLRAVPRLIRATRNGSAAAKERETSSPVKVPEPVADTPVCSLNDAFTLRRSYARSTLSLADVKAVKQAAGVSLNDVVLALVAGALRQYLVVRDDLPDKALVANVPVGFEPPDSPPRQFGNSLTNISTTLATHIADPLERMRAISTVTAEARLRLDLAGVNLMADWLEVVPPFIAEPGLRSLQRRRREHREEAEFNVVVSNIRGPAEHWRFHTAAVESLHIQGPPTNGVGPNVMLWSYGDHLLIGVLAFADAMADPHEFSRYLQDALDELLMLTTKESPSPHPA